MYSGSPKIDRTLRSDGSATDIISLFCVMTACYFWFMYFRETVKVATFKRYIFEICYLIFKKTRLIVRNKAVSILYDFVCRYCALTFKKVFRQVSVD